MAEKRMTAAQIAANTAAQKAGKSAEAVKEGEKKLKEEEAAKPSLGEIARQQAEKRKKAAEAQAKAVKEAESKK